MPPLARFVPGYEASAVTGIGVPKGTPAEIVETLNKAVQAAFADAGDEGEARRHRRRAAAGLGGGVRALMAAETEKWGKVVKAAGIKAD